MIITGATVKSQEKLQDEDFLKKLGSSKGMVHQKKDDIQNRALQLSVDNPHLVLSWATGCGKSLAALKIIKSRVDSGDTTPWFIVCSELNHISNWIAEIVKHKLSYLMDHIEIFCYASLGKYKHKKANLILDESHSVSDLRLDHLQTITANQIISLSATLNNERKNQLNTLRKIREYEITITDAINVGLLPSPKIYIIYDKLNNDADKPYMTYVKKKGGSKLLSKVIPKIDSDYASYFTALKANKDLSAYELHVKCNEQQYYDLITNDVEYYKEKFRNPGTSSAFHKNKMLRLGNERKVFISNKKSKLLSEVDNMLSVNAFRYITFTGSIEQCNEIGKDRAIHSLIPLKKRKEIIEKFNNKEIDSIYAVEMLREGQNFEEIHAGIITQLDSDNLSFVQMMGRVFRSTDPILFVLVKDNTRDITYLKKCIDGLDSKYLTYVENTPENMQQLNRILCQEKLKREAKVLEQELS